MKLDSERVEVINKLKSPKNKGTIKGIRNG